MSTGTSSDGEQLWLHADGRFSAPVGSLVGVQVDVQGQATWGAAALGAAGHLFLRDPGIGLVGLYGSISRDVEGAVESRIGLETEIYLGPVTASGLVTVNQDQQVEAQARLSVYPSANTKLYFGIDDIDATRLSAGMEQGLDSPLSLFAEVQYDRADESVAVLGGLRVQFGAEGRSLMQRDREDVAPLWQIVDKPVVESPEASASPTSGPSSSAPISTSDPVVTSPPIGTSYPPIVTSYPLIGTSDLYS